MASHRPPSRRARRGVLPLLAVAALAAAPAAATADVNIGVPVRFLGGPIAPAVPVAAPVGGGPAAGDALSLAGPAPAGAALLGYPCDTPDPADCMDWTDAGDLTPPPGTPDAEPGSADPPVIAAAPRVPDPATAAATAGGLIAPAPESWLPWQTPLLRWRPSAGATHYNVQVFRGTRLVMSAWPRAAQLRVPRGVLQQGRTYVWVVWPGRGPRAAPRYGATPIGRATFQVTLRPRLVFRTPGGAPGTTIAEVRPHIPFGRLRLVRATPALRGLPGQIVLDARGFAALPVTARSAERLGAVLLDRGPTPPLGLRAP